MRAFFLWAVVLGVGAVAACGSAGAGSSPPSVLCASLDAGTCEGGGSPVDGPQPCRTNADCTSPFAFICNPGGGVVGCGFAARAPFPCNVDSDCRLIDGSAPPKPMVCGQPGGCVFGLSCIPACQADSDCGGGDIVCGSGHCVAKPCQVDSDCPSIGIDDFACSGTSGTRVCTLKGCASDADCHGWFCVNQTCSSQQGFCASSAV
jgi:hypothetical protein